VLGAYHAADPFDNRDRSDVPIPSSRTSAPPRTAELRKTSLLHGLGWYYLHIAGNTLGARCGMATTLTSKGQVTIPKKVREALGLKPGSSVEFTVSRDGQVVLHKRDKKTHRKIDRFEAARGKAQIKWRTEELMALLRGTER
jgi:AbrB family looped-hinge helix DNA binding protein